MASSSSSSIPNSSVSSGVESRFPSNSILHFSKKKIEELLNKYPDIEKKVKEGFTGGSVPFFNTYSLLHNMSYEYLTSDSRKFNDFEINKLEKFRLWIMAFILMI